MKFEVKEFALLHSAQTLVHSAFTSHHNSDIYISSMLNS